MPYIIIIIRLFVQMNILYNIFSTYLPQKDIADEEQKVIKRECWRSSGDRPRRSEDGRPGQYQFQLVP